MNVLAFLPFDNICSVMIDWRTSVNITRTAARCIVYHSYSYSSSLFWAGLCVGFFLLGTVCFHCFWFSPAGQYAPFYMADVFHQHRQRRCCSNKARLECERFFSARVSDLKWTSVWSGNLLSSKVISLTHCIVRWWGGPSRKKGATWPRFATAATAFCLVSSQKWSVLFSMFDLLPLHVTL